MEVSRSESVASMGHLRAGRTKETMKKKRNEDVSGHLRQYGKRLFDDAVHKANKSRVDNKNTHNGVNTPSCPFRSTPSPRCINAMSNNCNGHSHIVNTKATNTGPTKCGSPLFNNRAKLMNAIRTNRPVSGPGMTMYNDASTHTFPKIHSTICDISSNYRVVQPVQESGYQYRTKAMSLRDAIFVPNSSQMSSNNDIFENEINSMTAVQGCFLTDESFDESTRSENLIKQDKVSALASEDMIIRDNSNSQNDDTIMKQLSGQQQMLLEPEPDNAPPQVRATTPR